MPLTPSFRSLFWRLFAGISLVMLLTALCVSLTAYQSRKQDLAAGTIDWRLGGQKAVETALVAHRYGGTDGLVEWLVSPANRDPCVYLLARDGTEVSGRTVPQPALDMLEQLRSEGRMPTADASGEAVRIVEIEGEPHYAFATRTRDFPLRFRLIPLRGLPFAVFVVSALLLTLLVAWALAAYYTRPLRRLNQAMERFSLGELTTRVEASIGPADSEVTALARVFDRMAGRIEDLIGRQRRLFHDVSHEVRSPLARIEVALELARRAPDRTSSLLDRIEREVTAIDRLIEALLTYARLENGAVQGSAKTALGPLLEEIEENARFEAEGRSIRIDVRRKEGEWPKLTVRSEGEALLRALENIVRNALRHTPEGGTVELSVERTPQGVRLECVDTGPGIPETELPELFRPFVRGSREATGTGFGLGLAIAHKTVEAAGGALTVRNRTDRSGLIVTVSLPAFPDESPTG